MIDDWDGVRKRLQKVVCTLGIYIYITMYWYKIVFFSRNLFFFSFGGGSFHALSAAGHAGGAHVHDGASVGLARAPWRVLWAFKSRAIRQVITGSLSKAKQAHGKPIFFYRRGQSPLSLYLQQLYGSGRGRCSPLSLYHSSHGARPILPASVCLAALEAHSFVVPV